MILVSGELLRSASRPQLNGRNISPTSLEPPSSSLASCLGASEPPAS
ncbi:MAG: hypothetical protein F6K41_31405 [Symploca sp. SIO3E6]|nr:hypothetical protein [Caldora sp. SIO3E6]